MVVASNLKVHERALKGSVLSRYSMVAMGRSPVMALIGYLSFKTERQFSSKVFSSVVTKQLSSANSYPQVVKQIAKQELGEPEVELNGIESSGLRVRS